jgi:hypothetical protein
MLVLLGPRGQVVTEILLASPIAELRFLIRDGRLGRGVLDARRPNACRPECVPPGMRAARVSPERALPERALPECALLECALLECARPNVRRPGSTTGARWRCACTYPSGGTVRLTDEFALRVYRSLQHFGELNGRRTEPQRLARTLVELASDLVQALLRMLG